MELVSTPLLPEGYKVPASRNESPHLAINSALLVHNARCLSGKRDGDEFIFGLGIVASTFRLFTGEAHQLLGDFPHKIDKDP